MKVRFARSLSSRLDAVLPPSGNVTVFHLGRGGVNADGTLDDYNSVRVERTLAVARVVTRLRPEAHVQVIWAGGCNRKQDRSGTSRETSEGRAALVYACGLIHGNDHFTMQAEENSTSTVENATASAKLVRKGDTILVVTDPLHYVARKVQFIFWLMFPRHRRLYIQLPASPPGTNIKSVVMHLVSTYITTLGMSFVTRGDADDIQRRQVQLQKLTGH